MFLLDTNIVIGILRKREEILEKYKKLSEKNQKIYLTTYSLSEIYLVFKDQDFKKKFPEKRKIQKKLFNKLVELLKSQNRIIALSIKDAKKLGDLFYILKVNGSPIPVLDAIIGAIAISRNLIVLTSDKNHFETVKQLISEFKVEFW